MKRIRTEFGQIRTDLAIDGFEPATRAYLSTDGGILGSCPNSDVSGHGKLQVLCSLESLSARQSEYCTKRVILEIYDQMAEVIKANRKWRMANSGKIDAELDSQFAIRHAPQTDPEGNFIPMS